MSQVTRHFGVNQADPAEESFTIASLANKAAQYLRIRGQYTQARPLYQQALSIRERILAPDHLLIASSLNGLAELLREQGKYAEGESLYLRALQIREHTLGDAHPNTVSAQALYSQFLQKQTCTQEEAASEPNREEVADLRNEERQAQRTSLSLHRAANTSFSESDPLQEFLDACCELHPLAWCRISDL